MWYKKEVLQIVAVSQSLRHIYDSVPPHILPRLRTPMLRLGGSFLA
jgi:hypothetical protein